MNDKVYYEDGVHDIPNEAYHSAQGWSRSALLDLDKSPYHFYYNHIACLKERGAPTADMKIGSAVHTLLLEPEKFEDEFACAPDVNKRTKEGKQQYAEFEIAASGKIVLSKAEFQSASNLVEGIKKFNIVDDVISDAKIEQSIFWTDKETGLQFKCRPDVWQTNFVADVKTAKNVSHDLFARSALDSGYYVQAGMIYEALEVIEQPIEKYIFLAVEKQVPYVPKIFILDGYALDFGVEHFQLYKKKLAYHLKHDDWPGYEIENLLLPPYARNKVDLSDITKYEG